MDPDAIASLRSRYSDVGLSSDDLAADPITQFDRWFSEVVALALPEPNAMILATADADGRPSTRHVLLKGVSAEGFVFYTNYGSRKARELAVHPFASLCFPWFPLARQVIVTGSVSKVSRAQTTAYFGSRPRESQLGAWASEHQSDVVPSREALDAAYAAVAEQFADISEVPAPPFWGGFLVSPTTVEFWQGRTARMHDRLRYRRAAAEPAEPAKPAQWILERLSP